MVSEWYKQTQKQTEKQCTDFKTRDRLKTRKTKWRERERERENERMREWENERMREWENERMREWENERMREWENERMREWENERERENTPFTRKATKCANPSPPSCLFVLKLWRLERIHLPFHQLDYTFLSVVSSCCRTRQGTSTCKLIRSQVRFLCSALVERPKTAEARCSCTSTAATRTCSLQLGV